MEGRSRSQTKQILFLLLFLLACAVVAAIGAVFTATAMNGWYQSLKRPEWSPPDAVFGPVWTILYTFIGASAWLVWRARDWHVVRSALAVWGLQLCLNLLWTVLFFGLQSPGLAFGGVVVLWVAIAATIIVFWPVSRIAAVMLVPYLGWVSFAAALNYSIWMLN
jgi:translocator protein